MQSKLQLKLQCHTVRKNLSGGSYDDGGLVIIIDSWDDSGDDDDEKRDMHTNPVQVLHSSAMY